MIFVSDIDNTLLGKDRATTTRTRAAIRQRLASGDQFLLCSARSPRSMRLIELEYSDTPAPMIAFNGALVVDAGGRTLASHTINHVDRLLIHEVCANARLHCSEYLFDEWLVSAHDRWSRREARNTRVGEDGIAEPGSERPAHKIMCMGDPAAIDALTTVVEEIPRICSYRAKDEYLELAPRHCTKGSGLEVIVEHLGADLDEVVYFGDNFNDLSAMQRAKTSVAVANGRDEVLRAADHVTGRSTDDGVADYLERC